MPAKDVSLAGFWGVWFFLGMSLVSGLRAVSSMAESIGNAVLLGRVPWNINSLPPPSPKLMKSGEERCLCLFTEGGWDPASLLLNAEHPQPPKPARFPHWEWCLRLRSQCAEGMVWEEEEKREQAWTSVCPFPSPATHQWSWGFLQLQSRQVSTPTPV